MSSTRRGKERVEHDVYPTPLWVVDRLLDQIKNEIRPTAKCLEPCAADGGLIRHIKKTFPESRWSAAEIRPECRASLAMCVDDVLVIDDFLTAYPALEYDVIVTNPPFKKAMEFVKKCLPKAGMVCFLLRLNFMASEKRADFMRTYAPDVYLLPNRPSFGKNKKGKRGTDSIEYAWFVWRNGKKRRKGTVLVLDSTPAKERGAVKSSKKAPPTKPKVQSMRQPKRKA